MIHIKLDAIDSTNDYLKTLCRSQNVANFTTVSANLQTNGKGQMGSKWNSESSKNLLMSVLLDNIITDIKAIFDLNILASLSVLEVLKKMNIPDLAIKWPNDIMAGNKKIAGILVENMISDTHFKAVVGIGLNVNQEDFEDLQKATSLKNCTGIYYDVDSILKEIVATLATKCDSLNKTQLWEDYHQHLFRKNKPTAFEDLNNHQFMGIIKCVTLDGLLEIILEDDSLKRFAVKKVKMLF